MTTAVSYGSITIVDLTDIGQFSVQPMANLPLSVIYDPDQNTFTPNWATSNLQITPSVYYAGNNIALGTNGLTITWERQEGVGSRGSLTTGESIINNGILKINQTKFTSSSTMITYIVTAQYVEATSQQTLTAQGQITFTLVRNASTAKQCVITGESIFKYNSSNTLVGATSITLTGKVDNVSIVAWQYKNGSGDWVTYPNSTTDTTLIVNATDNVFTNDKCIIRLKTNDDTVYDLHTITNLRDGAPGSSTISAVLTNDDQMIPYDTPTSTSPSSGFTSTSSQIIIYEGPNDVTHLYTIVPTSDGNCTFTTSKTNTKLNASSYDTVTVTAMSAATSNITFTCTRSNYTTIVKTFSLIKVTSGADGISPTIYSVEADVLALNKDIHDVFTPSSVTFRAYEQTKTNKTSYSGRFEIYENITLAAYNAYNATQRQNNRSYVSTSNEALYTYTPSTSAQTILCVLYQSGGTSTKLDTQTVVVTSDGATGQTGATGADGASAVNIILGNYADVLTCTSANKLSANQTITVPFAAYEGTTRIPCTVASIALLGKNPTITPATASVDGSIVWALTSGTSVSSASGSVSLTFTATASTGSIQVVETYSWSRNTAATNGLNNATITLYQRGASAPSKPSGNLTYNFSSGVISGDTLGNWTQQIPSGTDPVWAISATASSTAASDTIGTGEWSSPLKVLENGEDGSPGYNQATIFLYQRATSAPSKPSSSITYTFATGALSSIPSGWSRTIPASNGNPCWVTTAVAVSQSASASIPSTAWADITKMVEDGANSVQLQIFTPDGTNILNQTVTSARLQATLTDGSVDSTSSVTQWSWAKFVNGAYAPISGATSAIYTVQDNNVDSYASFRCTAKYHGIDYVAYFSVFDKTDPIQVSVLCSLGNQIVNGQGAGAIYAMVTRNGEEIDAIKSERFLTENPATASSGDYYYKLDSTNKTVTLMKYTNSWAAVSDSPYTGTYRWSWRDKDGNAITAVDTYTLPTTGKVIYIDGDLVNGKIIADVEVTI